MNDVPQWPSASDQVVSFKRPLSLSLSLSLSRPDSHVCKVPWTLVLTYLSLPAATVVGVYFSEIQTVKENVVVVHVYWDHQFLSVTPPHIYHTNGKNRQEKRKCLPNMLLDLTDIGTLQCCRMPIHFRLLKYIWMKAKPSLWFSSHNKQFLSMSSNYNDIWWRIIQSNVISMFTTTTSITNNEKPVCDGMVGITSAW